MKTLRERISELLDAPYEKVPYPGVAYPFACPDRMGVMGRVHGLATRTPAESTVLEIGLGEGSNLISIAHRFPGAQCIGIDASPTSIAGARRRANELGLRNLTLFESPLEAFADAGPLPRCDYIIAHGVLSWVSPLVRDALFRLVSRLLAPSGVGMLSFLTSPGHHDFGPLVELMRHHVATVPDLEKKVAQARDIALWHLERTRRLHGEGRARLLEELVTEVMDMPDAVLLHDLLAPERHALTITDFAVTCRASNLQWLANARMNEPRTTLLPESLRELVRATPDVVKRQHYLDSFLMTRFRTSLICRADEEVTRTVPASAFANFFVASRFDAEALGSRPAGTIDTAVGRLTLSSEASAVLNLLAHETPAASHFESVMSRLPTFDADTLGGAVAELWFADAIELSLHPPAVAHGMTEFPRTGSWQRLLAREGRPSVTSLWHREYPLDETERQTLLSCDGGTARGSLPTVPLASLLRQGFILAD